MEDVCEQCLPRSTDEETKAPQVPLQSKHLGPRGPASKPAASHPLRATELRLQGVRSHPVSRRHVCAAAPRCLGPEPQGKQPASHHTPSHALASAAHPGVLVAPHQPGQKPGPGVQLREGSGLAGHGGGVQGGSQGRVGGISFQPDGDGDRERGQRREAPGEWVCLHTIAHAGFAFLPSGGSVCSSDGFGPGAPACS